MHIVDPSLKELRIIVVKHMTHIVIMWRSNNYAYYFVIISLNSHSTYLILESKRYKCYKYKYVILFAIFATNKVLF